jgi:hypothetical protein
MQSENNVRFDVFTACSKRIQKHRKLKFKGGLAVTRIIIAGESRLMSIGSGWGGWGKTACRFALGRQQLRLFD